MRHRTHPVVQVRQLVREILRRTTHIPPIRQQPVIGRKQTQIVRRLHPRTLCIKVIRTQIQLIRPLKVGRQQLRAQIEILTVPSRQPHPTRRRHFPRTDRRSRLRSLRRSLTSHGQRRQTTHSNQTKGTSHKELHKSEFEFLCNKRPRFCRNLRTSSTPILKEST